MQKHLEEEVSKTAAVVSDWKNSIAKIETQFNVARLAVAKAQKSREAQALKATMGDAAAVAAIKLARDEKQNAEQIISDLKFALPEAQAQLAAAEKAAASARHALAMLQAEKLMRQRVDVSGQIDQVNAESARLYRVYEELGREIVNMPDVLPRNMHGMNNHEGAVGARRVRAALPAFVQKLYPGSLHDEMKKEPLAVTEARFWNLTVDTTTKADDESGVKNLRRDVGIVHRRRPSIRLAATSGAGGLNRGGGVVMSITAAAFL